MFFSGKKIPLVCFMFFALALSAHGEIVRWISPEPQWTFKTGVTFETDKNLHLDSVPVDFSAAFSLSQFQCSVGMQFQPSVFDFSTYFIYSPTFFNHLNVGVKSLFHTKHFTAEYLELDLLVGLYAMYRLNRYLAFDSDFMFHLKLSKIYSIEDSMPWIKNNSFAFRFEAFCNPVQRLTLGLGVSSYSMYRYNLFFSPDYWISAEYKFVDFVSVGTKALIEYIDMYTLSANRRLCDFTVYVKLEI